MEILILFPLEILLHEFVTTHYAYCILTSYLLFYFCKHTKLYLYGIKMYQFQQFQKILSPYPVFSLRDIQKITPNFHRIQLDRWEKKGYLKKIRRGFYCFHTIQDIQQNFLLYAANKLYAPSYVSLETALKYYGFIPEEIFQTTSVSTKKTTSFKTSLGNFRYQHIKPRLYWGYRLIDFGKQKILMAEPEKAILDYLYLHATLKTEHDMQELRINADELRSQINQSKFQKYIHAFGSKQLAKRAKVFLTTTHASALKNHDIS